MPLPENAFEPLDIDILLTDASLDPALRPERRAIAALSIGVGLNDAFYSVLELEDVLIAIGKDVPGSRCRLATLLGNRCDDYQRAIYYALAGRGAAKRLEDLGWLIELLGTRSAVAHEAVEASHATRAPRSPYVTAEADGPVGAFPARFALGPDWSSRRD
ncbi:hypothetical protein PX554_19860 [Sphingomonas sp. H39-1-10]|uniref:hypothetical protein n=1 Tax=Sphingomonas pollutisoli TaxID=3030829 RepID=UPI0023B9C341|nr:hypothetical protein [Sphingomonas pollutisoli]MDF0490388.1 hypothetical protein [Sphingomonas pollutisoli]